MFGLEPTQFYILIASVLVITIISVLFLIFKKTKKSKTIVKNLDYQELLEALGGSINIIKVSLEHQRLKVILNDLKIVNQNLLKKLEIPAFLKGKELTLLIKNQTKEVLSYLSERQKEVN